MFRTWWIIISGVVVLVSGVYLVIKNEYHVIIIILWIFFSFDRMMEDLEKEGRKLQKKYDDFRKRHGI